MGTRRKSREHALQILYQKEFSGQTLKEILAHFWVDHPTEDKSFTETLVEGTLRNLLEIDGLIEKASTNWKMTRMASVDRNLLRMASFELIYLHEIPNSVTLNEAIEIAKLYGTEESSSFINGILDKIANRAS